MQKIAAGRQGEPWPVLLHDVGQDRPGEPADDFIDSAVSMDQVEAWARQIESLHAMFVFNSCYSGTIFWAISRTRGGLLPVVVDEAVREPVRLFITAGNDKQQVPDSSAFLKSLLAALTWEEDADSSRDGFLSGGELCLFLKERVTPANGGVTPQCGTMPPPYNRGDLIFVKPHEERQRGAEPPARTSPAISA